MESDFSEFYYLYICLSDHLGREYNQNHRQITCITWVYWITYNTKRRNKQKILDVETKMREIREIVCSFLENTCIASCIKIKDAEMKRSCVVKASMHENG